jgi:hypothetical protein
MLKTELDICTIINEDEKMMDALRAVRTLNLLDNYFQRKVERLWLSRRGLV